MTYPISPPREEQPEYTGSILTSTEPLTPSERLGLFQFRWPETRFYRVLPVRKAEREVLE